MTKARAILIATLIVLITLNGYFIIKDIKNEININRTTIQNSNTIAEKNIKILQNRIQELQDETKKTDTKLLTGQGKIKLMIVEKENNLKKSFKTSIRNLPGQIKIDRIALEQKLMQINIRVNNNTAGALGSGVSIKYKGKFYILTAGHMADVIENGEQNKLELCENEMKICDLEIVKHDFKDTNAVPTKNTDLLLLRSKNESLVPRFYVDIESSEPILGTEVYIVGNPMGLDDAVSMGRVIKFIDNFMYITDSIYFGNSGGGVYSTEGKLLGIVSHMQPIQPYKDIPPYMIYGIVRMNTIREFMKGVE
jgi:hypothetical protein